MQARPKSLRAFFEQVFVPSYLTGARPRTIREYSYTMNQWDRLVDRRQLWPIDLDAIDTLTLSRFRSELLDGRSPATVNKHLRHINAVLAKLGPPAPGNRDALAWLDRVPWVKPLKEAKRLPRFVADELIARAYAACRFATHPRGLEGIAAAAWWRALIVMAITTGFRHEALMSLRWSQCDVPRAEIRISAEQDKCGRDRQKPLHRLAIKHILAIKAKFTNVFPWTHGARTRYRQWQRILDHADVAADDRFGLHDLKRTAGTKFAAAGSPWVVQQMLDHASLATSRHYVNPTADLRSAVDALPLTPLLPRVINLPHSGRL